MGRKRDKHDPGWNPRQETICLVQENKKGQWVKTLPERKGNPELYREPEMGGDVPEKRREGEEWSDYPER